MTVLVYATRFQAPLPDSVNDGWEQFGLTWHGWDGSIWNLRDETSGVFVTNAGILGLDDPAFLPETQESPAKSGRWRTDYRIPHREVELPVFICHDDGSLEWQQLFRAFRKSFHPLKPGRLEVASQLGVRSIELFLESDGNFAYTRDPGFDGWALYPLKLTAEDPLWRGAAVARQFRAVEPTLFFGVDGNLHIGAATLASADLDNEGDEAAWAKITVIASGVSDITATLSIDGGELGPPEIPMGSTLVIDTDPAVGSAELDGVEVDGQVDPWDPRPVPPGEQVPLDLTLTGFGEVIVEITPRYWRAL